ncbi:MAG: MBL fold metallo-hydrolase [Patescibacteria group bacterium]|nr:MBL fold metallo-hydrolase [Patescibacteria group bacterium]
MKITKYPQSAILIEDYKNKRILIDPGSYCYNENFKLKSWGKIDILLFTHVHGDHFMPEVAKILKEINPNLFIASNLEVKAELDKENIASKILQPNEIIEIDDIKIKGVKSIHGDLPNGKPKPDVIGFLIDDKFYHPGDTIYLQEKPYADIVFVPICGVVVMNVEEAVRFVEEINPKIAIPIHYDNPNYPVSVDDFASKVPIARVLKNGESLDYLDYNV